MPLTTIAVSGHHVEAWVARPPRGEAPGVLMFMDAIGLRPQIHAMADRIASWGFVVLAPNVFFRSGTAEETSAHEPLMTAEARAAFFAQAMPRVGALTADLAVADIADYVTALRSVDGAAPGPIATIGYCMGARLAVRAACTYPDDVAAVGGFHGGGLVTDNADSPHRGLSHARARFVFGHADNDRSMGADAVAALGATLAACGLDAVNEVYADAPHGYTMADTLMYRDDASERHFAQFRRLLAHTFTDADHEGD